MKKMLSLVLSLVMIFSMLSFPVSANNLHEETGEFLKTLGIIKGDENGNLNSMNNLTREEAISILVRMLGKSEEAKLTGGESGFKDVPKTHWAANDIAYARNNGLTSGIGDGEFGIKRKVTTKEIASFMLRSLSHTADWGKEDIMEKSRSLGLLTDVSAQENSYVIRGEVFVIMKNTLYSKMNNSEEILAQKLGYEAPAPQQPEPQEPADIELVSVKADNLKEIKFEFNSKVDKDSLTSAFRVVGGSLGALTPEVSATEEKVVIVKTQNTMANKKSYKMEVSKVKNVSGDVLDKKTVEFTVDDTQVPAVEGIMITGPKSLDILFNEPIRTAGSLELKDANNRNVTSNVVDFTAGDKLIHVNTAALKEGGYKLAIKQFGDFAGYVNIELVHEFDYEKMSDAPTVKILGATAEYVELEFSRPVKNMTLAHFHHSYDSWKPVAAYKNLDSMNENLANKLSAGDLKMPRDKVVLRFVGDVQNYIQNTPSGEHPLTGKTSVTVEGKVGSNVISDSWGNELKDYSEEIEIQADKTSPEVLSIEAISDKDIEVKFSKEISFKASNYKVSNANGTSLGFAATAVKSGPKSVKITLNSSNLAGKSFKVRVENVKDATIHQNKIGAPEEAFVKFEDKSFAGMKEALFIPGDGNSDAKIRVRFEEAVDMSSATTESNYRIKVGGSLQSVGFILSSINSDVVEFNFIRDEWKKTGAANTSVLPGPLMEIAMNNSVTDTNGNKIASFEQSVNVLAVGVAPVIVNGEAIVKAKNQIEFWFNQEVTSDSIWETDKFSATSVGVLNVNDVSEEVVSGKTKITLKLADDALSANMRGETLSYTGAVKLKNSLGVAHTWAAISLVDKVSPSIDRLPADKAHAWYTGIPLLVASGYTKEDIIAGEPAIGTYQAGGKYYIVVFYDEQIDPASISNTTYKLGIEGVSIPSAKVSPLDDKWVEIEISRALTQSEVENLSIAQAGAVKDTNGNVKGGSSGDYMQVQKAFGENLK